MKSNSDRYEDIEPLFETLAARGADDPLRQILRTELIGRCLQLADHIARRFSGRGEPFDDLCQIARTGLIQAVDRFDPKHGSAFLSFAVPTIMGEVRRYFRDGIWTMHVPRRIKEIVPRINSAVDRLTQLLGGSPTAREIAATLDADPTEMAFALMASNAHTPMSFDSSRVTTNPITAMQQCWERLNYGTTESRIS